MLAADGVEFFAGPVELGPTGAEKILPLGPMSPFEQELYKAAIGEVRLDWAALPTRSDGGLILIASAFSANSRDQLKGNIQKGASFITQA